MKKALLSLLAIIVIFLIVFGLNTFVTSHRQPANVYSSGMK